MTGLLPARDVDVSIMRMFNVIRFSNLLLALTLFANLGLKQAQASKNLPNILWITSEDNGPHLGCYGDSYATTPNLDRLSKQGLRYTKASSTAPVCAPARTTIISGMRTVTILLGALKSSQTKSRYEGRMNTERGANC